MATVLFTGAGASRAIGYPLTSQLLPRVLNGIEKGDLFDGINKRDRNRQDCAELRQYLRGLLPGIEELEPERLPLITDLFSLVEYSIASGEALPIGREDTLRRCRDLLKQSIACVLISDFNTDWVEGDPDDDRESATLKRLVKWVLQYGSPLSIITTNYDTGLEWELYNNQRYKPIHEKVDLGFEWRDPDKDVIRRRPSDPAMRILKLHGSLDVLRCPLCGHTCFNHRGTIAHQSIRIETDDGNTCHCGDGARLELHIVAPSHVREMRDSNLLGVWRNAIEFLRHASEWFIAGYSLPPEDLAVRSLLLRAWTTAPKRPRVTVIQRGTDVENRYRALFPGCIYRADGLDAFLKKPSA